MPPVARSGSMVCYVRTMAAVFSASQKVSGATWRLNQATTEPVEVCPLSTSVSAG